MRTAAPYFVQNIHSEDGNKRSEDYIQENQNTLHAGQELEKEETDVHGC